MTELERLLNTVRGIDRDIATGRVLGALTESQRVRGLKITVVPGRYSTGY